MKSVKPSKPKEKPKYDYRVPVLEPEVAEKTVDGVYKIELPTPVKSMLVIDDEEKCETIQLKCHSLYVKKGDTVCACNSTVKTIVGAGDGDQTEIVECGKCRTAYLIRTTYDDFHHLKLNISVWDTNRNIKNLSYREHDDDYNYLVRFNK